MHDRSSALPHIPAVLVDTADALHAAGIDWATIIKIITVLVQTLLPLIQPPTVP